MSEKIYACLLRLYPANFRQAMATMRCNSFVTVCGTKLASSAARVCGLISWSISPSLCGTCTSPRNRNLPKLLSRMRPERLASSCCEKNPFALPHFSPAVSSASRRLVSSLFCSIGPGHFAAPVLKRPLPSSAPSTGKLLRPPNRLSTLPSRQSYMTPLPTKPPHSPDCFRSQTNFSAVNADTSSSAYQASSNATADDSAAAIRVFTQLPLLLQPLPPSLPPRSSPLPLPSPPRSNSPTT
jgi:hypothetical protein